MRKILFDRFEIGAATRKVAKTLEQDYKDKKDIVIAPILLGGMFFCVDLVRLLSFPHKMGYITTSKYPNGVPSTQAFHFKHIDLDCRDKYVILVDEICFTGETLHRTKEALLSSEYGAKDVKTCVLVDHIRPGRLHAPDYKALTYTGEVWMWGKGMDLDGYDRNLEDIVYDDGA